MHEAQALTNPNKPGESFYNIGLTQFEIDQLIALIDDDDDNFDEDALQGIKRKLKNKRKIMRKKREFNE
jgi:hypothetical protein